MSGTSDTLQLHLLLQERMTKVGRFRKQLLIEDIRPHIRRILWELLRELSKLVHMLSKPIYISRKTV